MTNPIDKEKYEKRILDQRESTLCKRLAFNYREKINKTDPLNSVIWKELADLADKKVAELEERETGKRPDIPYHQIGLPTGTILHLPGTEIEAKVYSNRTLSYKGREVYITPLKRELIDSGIARSKVANKWEVKDTGENVGDLYNKEFPKK